MPDSKQDSRPGNGSRRNPAVNVHQRSKPEVIAEAIRVAHDIEVRARAVESSPHPKLALEQLEAELDFACHLARDVRRLIGEQVETR